MNSLWIKLRFEQLKSWLLARHNQEFFYLLMLAFILGLVPVMLWGFSDGLLLPMALIAAVAVLLALLLCRPALFYVAVFALGVLWGGLDQLQTESFPTAVGEACFFSGKVVDILDGEENYFAELAEFSTDSVSFVMGGKSDDGWQGKLLIIGSNVDVRIGDKLSLAAVVREFSQTSNFGLAENNYLLNNGIGAVALAVQSSVCFEKLASRYSPLNLGRSVRELIFAEMTELPHEQQALLKGIGFGETGMLTNGDKAVLQQTGIMHVFAVSGMHITYVVMLAGAVLEFLRKRLSLGFRFVIVGTMAIVLAFCLVVGFTPSVVRSAIMSMAALLAVLLLRAHLAGHALVAAAFVMLLYQPRWLVQPGFMLSFAATAGIIFCDKYWQMLIKNRTFSATFAAQFAVMPILAYFFNTVSLIGFVISPFIAVASGVVVILIVLSMVLTPLGLGLVPLSGAGILAELMYKVSELFAALPLSFTYTPKPTVWAILLYYVLLVVAYMILTLSNVVDNVGYNDDKQCGLEQGTATDE